MRRSRYRPPVSAPEAKAPGFGQWLLEQFRAIGEDLSGAATVDVDATIRQERLEVPAGATRRVSPTPSGTVVVLEAPSSDNAGEQVTLFLENPRGTLTVVSSPHVGSDGKVSPSLINGERQGTFTRAGVVVLHSNGVDGWKTPAEAPAETSSDTGDDLAAALGAQVVLGAADGSFPNGRVATDSTEVDAVLTVSGVISWALNTASVAFSKLSNLAGLSVLGRATNSSGVMAAITATAGSQRLSSTTDGTSIEWHTLGGTEFEVSLSGTLTDYVLPAAIQPGDTLAVTLTGSATLNSIVPPLGVNTNFWFFLALRDVGGNFALTIPDVGTFVTGKAFRTPGQPFGGAAVSYVMSSEEEACVISYSSTVGVDIWRIIAGTAAQAIDGDITVAGGNGGTRTAAITAGVIVNADINASAAIALSKLATQAANTVVANATAGTAVPTAVAVGTNTVVGRVAGNIVAATLVNAQIATNTITATTQAQMAANTVKSNATAGTANESDLAVGTNTVVGRVAGNIVAAALVNAQVDAAAAIALSKLATQAAESFVGNFTSGVAVPTALAGSTVAGAGLTYSTGGILAVGAGTGITVNANDVAVTIPLTDGDKGDITVASSGASWTVDAGTITPAKLASIAANFAPVGVVFYTAAAGTPGAPDDVTLQNANIPFGVRWLEWRPIITTPIALGTVQVRDTAGGAGAALSSLFAAALAGEATVTTSWTATATSAASSSAFLRRSDAGIALDLVGYYLKT